GFIVGYGIAPSENEEYWVKFITLLSEALNLNEIQNLVLISDRDKGLQFAIESVVPNAAHSYCVAHIERNIKSRFRKSCSQIWAAAKASSQSEFNRKITEIGQEKGSAVESYIRNIPSKNWVRAFFPVARYGHVTSNMAESINSSIRQLRSKVPLEIMIGISRMINANILSCSASLSTFNDNEMAKKYKLQYEDLCIQSQFLSAVQIPNSSLYEVQNATNSTTMRVVDTLSGNCSCMATQEFGFPCIHSCTLIERNIAPKELFISQKRLVSSLKQVYSGYVAMVDLEQLETRAVTGALTQRRRGRPPNNERLRSRAESTQRRRRCSMCLQLGH
ncbi:hypothetical protein ENBRE01_3435, partial [Enteropsectra breve]